MAVKGARSILCVLACVCAAQLRAQGNEPDLDWIDTRALNAGQVVVQTGKAAALIVTVDVAVLIGAPAQAIWAVLTACEIAPEYVPHVTDCTLVDTFDDGRSEIFRQTVKPAFFVPAFEHVFRLDYDRYRRIDVSRVGGLIAHMEGTWWLIERDDGKVLLVHHLELDPGLPVPRFFVRAALKRDLPKVLSAVRDRSEAGA